MSRTHTTSTAPAPMLAPATVEFANASNEIITLLHSDIADPNRLQYVNAYDEASLRELARTVLPAIKARREALERNLSDATVGNLQVSEKIVKLWQERKAGLDESYAVLSEAETSTSELTLEGRSRREEFLRVAAKAWGVDLKEVILKLERDIGGPFILGKSDCAMVGVGSWAEQTCAGDQYCLADMHLIAWLARVLHLSGASGEEDGRSGMEKLGKRMGGEVGGGWTKLAVFWDAVRRRGGWGTVYGGGLH
ncbi:hypothetical protein AX15_006981 [Amanita polypyramis BW_CC]|nr:hypothetical protein AX15_006981 [Amanita polypyramis BW_CC]